MRGMLVVTPIESIILFSRQAAMGDAINVTAFMLAMEEVISA